MKILFISLYFPPAKAYGGALVSAQELCSAFTSKGCTVEVLTTDADGPGRKIDRTNVPHYGYRVRYARSVGDRFSPSWPFAFLMNVFRQDYVYVWGLMVWLLPLVVIACRVMKKRLVISPRGMLFPAALEYNTKRKHAFLALLKTIGIAKAALFHATSAEERQAIQTIFPAAKVVVVPNGVRLPQMTDRPSADAPRVVFLGRLHPIKQLEVLFEAFATLPNALRGKTTLQIAGDGDKAYEAELRGRCQRLGIADSVQFLGMIEGEAKTAMLRQATVLVLPSASENFGMVVAEALACATPVIASRGTPWRELDEHGCGWWVDATGDSLRDALVNALTLTAAQRDEMGDRGRTWMREAYDWTSAAQRLMQVE